MVSLHSPGCPDMYIRLASDSQTFTCLSLQSAEMKGMSHHTWLIPVFNCVCQCVCMPNIGVENGTWFTLLTTELPLQPPEKASLDFYPTS